PAGAEREATADPRRARQRRRAAPALEPADERRARLQRGACRRRPARRRRRDSRARRAARAAAESAAAGTPPLVAAACRRAHSAARDRVVLEPREAALSPAPVGAALRGPPDARPR